MCCCLFADALALLFNSGVSSTCVVIIGKMVCILQIVQWGSNGEDCKHSAEPVGPNLQAAEQAARTGTRVDPRSTAWLTVDSTWLRLLSGDPLRKQEEAGTRVQQATGCVRSPRHPNKWPNSQQAQRQTLRAAAQQPLLAVLKASLTASHEQHQWQHQRHSGSTSGISCSRARPS